MKRTKIIATIGPASEGRKVLTKIIEDGTNVARLNFSHSDFAWHGRVIREIRKIGKKMKRPIGIMADLQGPRIRIANGKDQKVKRGEIVRVGAGLGRLG